MGSAAAQEKTHLYLNLLVAHLRVAIVLNLLRARSPGDRLLSLRVTLLLHGQQMLPQ